MMTTTCWILWMPAAAALLVTDGEADDEALAELDDVGVGDAELSDEHAMAISPAAVMIAKSPALTLRINPTSPSHHSPAGHIHAGLMRRTKGDALGTIRAREERRQTSPAH
jgi:hypothetical protein